LFQENYHSGQFEGNECNDILKNLEKLEKYVPEEYAAFIEAFEAMNEVKKSCFGYKLSPDWYKTIKNLN